MGLWDKMKGAMNTLTGGGAEVKVEVGEATLGSSFEVVVTAKAKANIKFSKVYVDVKAIEWAEVRDVDYDFEDQQRRIEYVTGEYQTFKKQFVLSNEGVMEEGQVQTWRGEITIPDSENPSFDGNMIAHRWLIMGALDTFGNDPDSGWLTFEVFDN